MLLCLFFESEGFKRNSLEQNAENTLFHSRFITLKEHLDKPALRM